MIGQRLLHYQIVEKLGEGGMGVVYKARDTHLDRFVAIKVLPAGKVADADRKGRFVQEAKAASALNHPNIVHVYDIAAENGVDFIAMEFVDGKTLDQAIPRKGMRVGEALKIAVQIADALAAAHAGGIVHRDLKPANVMVTGTGLVKVLDFGLAKLQGPDSRAQDEETRTMRTHEGVIVGTAAFMSPEQAESRPVDARSDIFSFGCVLYEMATGSRAFRGDTTVSTLSAAARGTEAAETTGGRPAAGTRADHPAMPAQGSGAALPGDGGPESSAGRAEGGVGIGDVERTGTGPAEAEKDSVDSSGRGGGGPGRGGCLDRTALAGARRAGDPAGPADQLRRHGQRPRLLARREPGCLRVERREAG